MRLAEGLLQLTATDLSNHLVCPHKTNLEREVACGTRAAAAWVDPAADLMRERGLQHERRFIDGVRAKGITIEDLSQLPVADCFAATREAMARGASAIFQGALRRGRWSGRPDLLVRVERPSAIGAFSYEPWDAKLARQTQGTTLLQLCHYADLIEGVQQVAPSLLHVVMPGEPLKTETYPMLEYAAYYRCIRRRTELAVESPTPSYPVPVEHCDVCRWWKVCDDRRRADDHVSLVAGMSARARGDFEMHGHDTLAKVGRLTAIDFKPDASSRFVLERVRSQASIQLEGRETGQPRHRVLPNATGHGFNLLPEPDPADIFLDLEGDPFLGLHGREYLFGLATRDTGTLQYTALWGLNADAELQAFEQTIDRLVTTWRAHPQMHVFHFGDYEPATIRRLMSRFGTRELEVDALMRGGVFVNLLHVVRRALQASVESYSLKALEPIIGFERSIPLAEARKHLSAVSWALEMEATAELTPDELRGVEGYNRDDCAATAALRDWLENIRAAENANGERFERPGPPRIEPATQDRRPEATALCRRISAALPSSRTSWGEQERALQLLGQLLEFHAREERPVWWEYFHLKKASDEELLDSPRGVIGLELVGRRPGKRSPIDQFRFPPQELDAREGDEAHHRELGRIGVVVALDRATNQLELRRKREFEGKPIDALFFHTSFGTGEQEAALRRIAESVLTHGIDGDGKYRAARDLLLRRAPRVRGPLRLDGELPTDQACRLAKALTRGVLPVQGPPGSGKTYAGAAVIRHLVAAGLRVGVTANSHAVIRKLLDEAIRQAAANREHLDAAHKVDEKSDVSPFVFESTDNNEMLERLRTGASKVVGGTSWMWAREQFEESVDVLLIDEAGQMALANVVAVSQAAKSIVLLGDPQQLDQPTRGTHPDGVAISALEHMLDGAPTISDDRGIFLSATRRMSPAIAAFTSEVFYSTRLGTIGGLENQRLVDCGQFSGAGLWFIAVNHEGSTNSSVVEADQAVRIARRLLRGGGWTARDGAPRPLRGQDILVVAPFNAQVSLLHERLGSLGVRVGTVDRFQGQEAPVVIYSMTSSSPELAPRGLEFLYSLNRLNVATSRAQCACIVLGSPRLLVPDCKTARQMRLANGLCRYFEMSTALTA